MKRLVLASGVSGVLFGLGLAISGMTNPAKVLAFLDISGRWDPSLLFVLGGAVAITAGATRLVLRRATPVLDDAFHISSRNTIDPSLIFGAAIFGVGWGISGYCPGPGVALLASPTWETWAFLPAMLVGIAAHRFGRALLSRERRDSGGTERAPA